MAIEIGSKVGPYEIVAQAGAGGMGEVFEARDTRLERTVAIKVLHRQVSGNPDLRQRFEREAKAISSLNHPNICTLYDIGEHEGTSYLVMEYVEGETLSDRLAHEPLTNKETLEIAMQIADALDKAHRKGLVHRDMKPGNIMLTKSGAKLLDFGLAKLQDDGGVIEGVSGVTRTTPLTGAGTILGTVPYMSPEQLEGKEADARSDIFSFGAVLYEMATGKRAFEGDSQASLIASIMKVNPEPVSRLQPMAPPMFERVVNQCLEKDPENRWQSAGDLKRALKWIADGGSQVGIPAPVSRRRRTQQRVAWAVATVMTAAAAWLGTNWYLQWSRAVETIKSEISVAGGTLLDARVGGAACISHDGSRVVYIALDSTGNVPMLWVRPLNSLTPKLLAGTEGAQFPFWSFDDRYIAFVSFPGSKLKRILATGGPVQTLTGDVNGRGGSWNQEDVILVSLGSTSPLSRVPAAGGTPEPVTTLDSTRHEVSHRWPSFLPDGDHFLFFCRVTGESNSQVSIGSLRTGEYRYLFPANSNAVYSAGHILYVVDGTLMAVPFDAGAGELRGDPFPIAENATYVSNWSRGVFSASSNGTLAYRVGDVGSITSLVLADRSGKIIDTVDASGEHFGMRLSPDGRKVATDFEEANQSYADVWVIDIARKTRVRITFNEKGDYDAHWSPDGSRVVFNSQRDSGNGLYEKSADGTGSPRLLHLSEGRQLRPTGFTPDGKGIIVTRPPVDNEGTSLWYASADSGGEVRQILELPGSQDQGAVSPDGRWLAYISNESGAWYVYVTSFPDMRGRWQVSVDPGGFPRWSGDGSKIYYHAKDDRIMEVSVDGTGSAFKVGDITPLFKCPDDMNGKKFDVSADGQIFLLDVRPNSQNATSFVLVQNWQAEFAQ